LAVKAVAALDTNILIRYLVRDDEKQFLQAEKLIRSAIRAGETLYVPVTVLLEVEWVLRTSFTLTKAEVVSAISRLLSASELSFANETAIESALNLYQSHSADFSDCVHIALSHAAGESPLWTFDRAASKVNGAKLLTI
jgi:predicted nucleic-acid-binding protein